MWKFILNPLSLKFRKNSWNRKTVFAGYPPIHPNATSRIIITENPTIVAIVTVSIFSSILSRIYKGRYLPGSSWTRQHFWFTALKRNMAAYLSNIWSKKVIAGFVELVCMGKIPVKTRMGGLFLEEIRY
jgi:hypothetical protein